jgi:hypothetical protein
MQLLVDKIERLSEDLPLTAAPGDVGFSDTAQVRQDLGRTINYFHRIESEVRMTANHIRVLLPNDEVTEQFLTKAWVPQEDAHGVIFGFMLKAAGITVPDIPDREAGIKMRIGGRLGQASRHVEAIADYIYKVFGVMHERTTYAGYDSLSNKLIKLGEKDIVQDFIKPIMRQESGHLGYYRMAASIRKAGLRPWQIGIAREVVMRTYRPVGVDSDKDARDYGHVAVTLGEGVGQEPMISPVQALAETLLNNGNELPAFVLQSVTKCIQEEKEHAYAGSR